MEKANSDTQLIDTIKKSNKDFIEKELRPFLQIPSNTLNHEGIIRAKNHLLTYLSEISEEINEYEGEINPLIIANIKGDLDESLLIYMMYDTQPIVNNMNGLVIRLELKSWAGGCMGVGQTIPKATWPPCLWLWHH